jgi:aspartate 1-decarboxylase
MLRRALYSKIHRATVTHADINYEGSISLSPQLLNASGIHEHEAVWIWNVTNGNRFETYTILGEDDSRDISINGAAARLVTPGDVIIIACFAQFTEEELKNHVPKVIFVDKENQIINSRREVAGPKIYAV